VKKWHENQCREDDEHWKPRDDIVSKVRLTLMSMNELLKTVRYSNLFDLNHLMDAIDSINDEIRTRLTGNDETSTTATTAKESAFNRNKNYRGRLSKRAFQRMADVTSLFMLR
jgi:hypothetical protein